MSMFLFLVGVLAVDLTGIRQTTKTAIDDCLRGSPVPTEIGRIKGLERFLKDVPGYQEKCKPLLPDFVSSNIDYFDPVFIGQFAGVDAIPDAVPDAVCEIDSFGIFTCDPVKVRQTLAWVLHSDYSKMLVPSLTFQQIVYLHMARMKFFMVLPDTIVYEKLSQFYYHIYTLDFSPDHRVENALRTLFGGLAAFEEIPSVDVLNDLLNILKGSELGNQQINGMSFSQLLDELAPLAVVSGRFRERRWPNPDKLMGLKPEVSKFMNAYLSNGHMVPPNTPQEVLNMACGYLTCLGDTIEHPAIFQNVTESSIRFDFLAEETIQQIEKDDYVRAMLRLESDKPICEGNLQLCVDMLIHSWTGDLREVETPVAALKKLSWARYKLDDEIKMALRPSVHDDSHREALEKWIDSLARIAFYGFRGSVQEDARLLSNIQSDALDVPKMIFDTVNLFYGSLKERSYSYFGDGFLDYYSKNIYPTLSQLVIPKPIMIDNTPPPFTPNKDTLPPPFIPNNDGLNDNNSSNNNNNNNSNNSNNNNNDNNNNNNNNNNSYTPPPNNTPPSNTSSSSSSSSGGSSSPSSLSPPPTSAPSTPPEKSDNSGNAQLVGLMSLLPLILIFLQ